MRADNSRSHKYIQHSKRQINLTFFYMNRLLALFPAFSLKPERWARAHACSFQNTTAYIYWLRWAMNDYMIKIILLCDCSGVLKNVVAIAAAAADDDDDGRFPQKALINSQIRGIFACVCERACAYTKVWLERVLHSTYSHWMLVVVPAWFMFFT